MVQVKVWYSKPERFRDALWIDNPELMEKPVSWPQDYDEVYETDAPIESHHDISIVLEYMFEVLNINYPPGWNNRSMSVGDVIQIGEIAYYCASVGWKLVENVRV